MGYWLKNYPTYYKLLATIVICLVLVQSAKAESIDAVNVASIPVVGPSNQWHNIVFNPIDDQQLYLSYGNGEVRVVDIEHSTNEVLLKLSKHVPDNNFQSLTAFALHPSFHHKNQLGYLTFYTAHTEKQSAKNQHRPSINSIELKETNVDLIVNEWQLNDKVFNTVEPNSKREILRLSTSEPENSINQLSFNPYVKTWHENYGYLYISIIGGKSLSNHPLLSGSILRISPTKFGLRQYTVPNDNPFQNNDKINNEIIATGLGKIHQFFWQKARTNSLFISQAEQNRQSVFQVNYGNDWRQSRPKALAQLEGDSNQTFTAVYRGKSTPAFWQHHLRLISSDGWQLETITNLAQGNVSQRKWPIRNKNLTTQRNLSLLLDQNSEPWLFSPVNGNLLKLVTDIDSGLNDEAKISETKQPEPQQSRSIITFLLAIAISAAAVLIVYTLKHSSKNSTKAQLKRQYTRLEFSVGNNLVSMFKGQETTPSIELTTDNVAQSEILLNENSLNIINQSQGFNHVQEAAINEKIAQDYRQKMVDDKVRKLTVIITTKNKKKHEVCLYLRKGNNRLTKPSYEESLTLLLDWCWFIAMAISPDDTEARDTSKLPTLPSRKKRIRVPSEPITYIHKTVPTNTAVKTNSDHKPNDYVDEPSTIDRQTTIQSDSELINSLEKLVKFKEQGILTEAEFNQAKAKLLKDLVQN
ncbi:hypothetical protein J7384_06145 [Endozoicomonas sp. G2_1]|uniref:SHOCT domain-containing protein n=1 Tax=Endozoicomonas sp. G2_1 TaxID=2821091 RepID=UPI001ADA8094|nr:SHOCT domain-containing protein [Endozoicomonas sp. G2_1]MBO9489938.1 hypothetical protein [Endozoicomonas sp. G2_1]